ncbi:hypothetical protein [Pseudalkalibacillus caeni]|uniref:Uncharacterized protein n=1 Tax=Exobacillus caeni TaxID=2574798 RepID=A0A5R9F385_9BACL|nr:hypothetical protein [Pseudalkalibacillus caeni]TLS36038.1 hypothetical protein FCL54_16735 [Pseudalkalibacillus caeni]
MAIFIFGIPVLLIVTVIFMVVFFSKSREKGDEDVFKSVYVYLVLFATLMMVIGGGISVFMAVADMVSPQGYYQSFQEYKEMRRYDQKGEVKDISEDLLQKEYDYIVKDDNERMEKQAKNQLIKSLGFIIIPLPVFFYFNRMRRKGNA